MVWYNKKNMPSLFIGNENFSGGADGFLCVPIQAKLLFCGVFRVNLWYIREKAEKG